MTTNEAAAQAATDRATAIWIANDPEQGLDAGHLSMVLAVALAADAAKQHPTVPVEMTVERLAIEIRDAFIKQAVANTRSDCGASVLRRLSAALTFAADDLDRGDLHRQQHSRY